MYNLSITTLSKIKTQVLYIPLTVMPFLPTDQINKKKKISILFYSFFFFFSFACLGVADLEKNHWKKALLLALFLFYSYHCSVWQKMLKYFNWVSCGSGKTRKTDHMIRYCSFYFFTTYFIIYMKPIFKMLCTVRIYL